MFNSVAKYLWGGQDVEQGYSDVAAVQDEGHPEILEPSGEEGDWVLIGTAASTQLDDEQPQQDVADVDAATSGAGGDAASERLENSVAERPGVISPQVQPSYVSYQMMLKQEGAARRHEMKKVQKSISNKRCRRQNLIQDYNSSCKTRNQKNKSSRPSGFKSSRNTQRM